MADKLANAVAVGLLGVFDFWIWTMKVLMLLLPRSGL